MLTLRLETSNHREAREKARAEAHRLDLEFVQVLERRAAGAATQPTPLFTQTQVKELAVRRLQGPWPLPGKPARRPAGPCLPDVNFGQGVDMHGKKCGGISLAPQLLPNVFGLAGAGGPGSLTSRVREEVGRRARR